MSSLVCATCRKFYRVKKNGVPFEEGMPLGRVQADGGPESWGPYKLWMADLCECPDCGTQVLVTAARQAPLAEHFQTDYATTRERFAPALRVDDNGGMRP